MSTLTTIEPPTDAEPTGAPPAGPTHSTPAPDSSTPGRGRLAVVFVALLLAVLLAALDQTIVATALPTIAGDLEGMDQLSWVVTAYLLAATVALPIYGKLGDQLGRKGVFQCAIVLFAIGSALAGFAQNIEQLIGFRALQGVGAGGLMIGAQAIIADLVPTRERGRYMGLFGGAFGFASVIGPLAGGLFTEHASWRWCFWVNLPLCVVTLLVVGAVLHLPKTARRPRFDYVGTLLLAALSTCLVLVTSWGGTTYDWDSPVILGLAGGGLLAIVLFCLVERVVREPIVPLRLFRSGVFTVAGLIALALGVAMFGTLSYLPLFLQLVDGASPTESGLLMLPMVLGILVGSVTAGRLMTRTGRYKAFPIIGTVLTAIGMGLLSLLDETSTRVEYGSFMAIAGLGIGLVLPTLMVATQNAVPRSDLGVATAASTYMRQIGGCLGAAGFGALFTERLLDRLPEQLPTQAAGRLSSVSELTPDLLAGLPAGVREQIVLAYADALPPTFLLGIPVLAVGFLLALVLKEKPLQADASAAQPVPDQPIRLPMQQHTEPDVELATESEDVDREFDADRDSGLDTELDLDFGTEPSGLVVRQSDGAPVDGAAVTLTDLAGNQVARGSALGDGRYQIEAPEPGTYVLIVGAHGYHPNATVVELDGGDNRLQLTLHGESGLVGRVRRHGGGPVDGATVTLTNHHGEVIATQSTNAEGAYAFGDLVPGTYTMAVSARAYRPAALVVHVPDTGKIHQDVELVGGAALHGKVRSRVGRRPMPDARVSLIDTSGRVLDVTSAGPDGSYRFSDIPEGEYTVLATAQPPAASSVRITGGEDREYDMELAFPDA